MKIDIKDSKGTTICVLFSSIVPRVNEYINIVGYGVYRVKEVKYHLNTENAKNPTLITLFVVFEHF